MLRGYARSHNRLLSQTAHEIISGDLAITELAASPRSKAT
jgi:hypothetical protein